MLTTRKVSDLKYVVMLSVLFLTGCGDAELMDARSEYVCLGHGGVHRAGRIFLMAQCNDGISIEVNHIILPEGHRVGE